MLTPLSSCSDRISSIHSFLDAVRSVNMAAGRASVISDIIESVDGSDTNENSPDRECSLMESISVSNEEPWGEEMVHCTH